MEPLTALMTDEQLKKKQEQQKARAPPPGTSRMLSRANREQRKQTKQVVPIISKQNFPPPLMDKQPAQQQQQPNEANKTEQAKPTLGHVINIERENNAKTSATVLSIKTAADNQIKINHETKVSKIIENNDAEEWQTLIDELNPGNCSTLINDSLSQITDLLIPFVRNEY